MFHPIGIRLVWWGTLRVEVTFRIVPLHGHADNRSTRFPGITITRTIHSMISPDRFSSAIAGIDAANAEDPTTVSDGTRTIAAELLYSHRMTRWLEKLYPQASEPLHLAARAQHIRRWTIPRSQYPMDRAGYHRWRTSLYSFHADTAAAILQHVGYDETTIARVRSLLKKERLKADAETQALEDVICLVFLENYFADFAPKHDAEKVIGILRRTWAKMSPIGRDAAMKLPLPPAAADLVRSALSGPA
jgi:hypothetical protein